MRALCFLLLILLTSCLPEEPGYLSQRTRKVYHPDAVVEGMGEPTTKFVDAFGLKSNLAEFDKQSMKLHGKFFGDRISFYTIVNPGIRIHDTEVEALTLYFIDSALMRKKYAMKGDISADLIQSFGNFKFKPLHDAEKVALYQQDVIHRKNGKVYINERLANYQLKWVQEINTLSYVSQFNFADSTSRYELVQEINYYRPYFRTIEHAF